VSATSPCAQRILTHIIPFLIVALAGPKGTWIDTFLLPEGSRNLQLTKTSRLFVPLIPKLHEIWQRFRVQRLPRDEEAQVRGEGESSQDNKEINNEG